MLTTQRSVVIGLMLFWVGAIPTQAVRAGEDVRVIKGVSYGDPKEGIYHQADLYLPADENYPVVVFAHGGAWMFGDKGSYDYLGKYLARRGIGAVIVNYRLSPKMKHPGHVQDVAKAVAWTHRNIGKHGGNRDNMFLCGYSAGGHLVSLLGTDESFLKAEGLGFASIRGVISISGVYAQDGLPALDMVFPKQDRGMSFPMHHAKAGRPQFMLFCAEKEICGLDKQAVRFHDEMKAAGCAIELHHIKGTNHNGISTEQVVRTQYGTRLANFVTGGRMIAKAAQ